MKVKIINYVGKLLALTVGIVAYSQAASIKIIYTAALLDRHFEGRKQEYIHTLRVLSQLGYEPYIVEAIKKKGPTFLDQYCTKVFYAQSNNPNLRNKGVNEASTMLEAFNYFDFDDEDMIIKLTGRYYFESTLLFQRIEKNPDYDAFVKSHYPGEFFTGCFAMRYKYFKHMLEQLDFATMEKHFISVEHEVAEYIKKAQIRFLQLNRLGVAGRNYASGGPGFNHTRPVTHW